MNPSWKILNIFLTPALLLTMLTACGAPAERSATSTPRSATPSLAPTQTAAQILTPTPLPPALDEALLASAILPPADGAFCNWQILGKNTQEIYAWVLCEMTTEPHGGTSMPVIIKLDARGHYGQVVQSESESAILELLPEAVRKRVLATDIDLDALQQRMTDRLADPSLPPLVITTGALEVPPNPPLPTHTPAPTPMTLPTLINSTVPARPGLSINLIQHWGEGPADGAVWSPDGQQIAMLRSTGVSLHSAANLKETHFFATSSRPLALAYRPDGKRLAVGLQDGEVIIWDLAAGEIVRTFSGEGQVQYLAFSPNGKQLLEAYVEEATAINLWDAESGSLLHTLSADPDVFMNVFFTPDGQALAWVYSGPTQPVWDVTRGKVIRMLSVDWPAQAAHNRDGSRFATATNDGLIQIWQPAGETFALLKAYQNVGLVTELAFDPAAERLAFVNQHGEVWLWDWQKDQAALAFAVSDPATNGNHWIGDLSFSPDGKSLLTIVAGQVQTWNAQTAKARAAFEEQNLAAGGLFLNDGRMIMITADRQAARLVDLKNNAVLQSILASPAVPDPYLAMSPDGAWIAASDGSVTDIFATGTQHAIIHIQSPPGTGLQAVFFSPDSQQVLLCFLLGDTVTGNPQSQLQLWDLNTGQLRYSLKTTMLGAVAFDPNGGWFAVGGYDNYVTIYATADGKRLQTLQGPADLVLALAATDGKTAHWLAAGSQDGTVCIWDTQTWQLQRRLGPRLYTPSSAPRPAPVTALAFRPDGGLLVSASAEGWLRFWNPASGELLAEQQGHTEDINSLSFRKDGAQLISASRMDGTLRLWGIEEEK